MTVPCRVVEVIEMPYVVGAGQRGRFPKLTRKACVWPIATKGALFPLWSEQPAQFR